MTFEKVLAQIINKKGKVIKFKKHNSPKIRKFGRGIKICVRCGRVGRGVISKYGIKLCRQCFREVAEKIGFKKYN
jgi:small subunit ribosomal protein S14